MKFRKNPIEVEAHCFAGDAPEGEHELPGVCRRCKECPGMGPHVHTLEGPLHISEGDWIIRGVKGEFYPCKPEVFAATYTPVFDEQPPAEGEGKP